MLKQCTYCQKKRSLKQFVKRKYKNGTIGHRSYCKKCNNRMRGMTRNHDPEYYRLRHLRKTYGLTDEQRMELVKQQESKCAICYRSEDECKTGLHIDHCHSTGIIRGLLCIRCNTAIGSFKNDVALLKSAIAYLDKGRQ